MTTQVTTRDKWATPQSVVDAVSEIMGSKPYIDLAASSENKKAGHFIGEHSSSIGGGIPGFAENNPKGLFEVSPSVAAKYIDRSDWAWCNPPYSRGNLPRFTEWCAKFAQAGGTVALLVPASQSDGWWRENIAPHLRMMLVPRKRIQFEAPEGVEPSSNSGQNIVAILAPRRPWDGEPVVRYFDF